MNTIYYHIDTIGIGDNRLQYNDQEIRNRIEIEIIRNAKNTFVENISAILIT